MVSEILSLIGIGGGGAYPPGDPRSMSLNVYDHKEQQYIWFRGGDLNGFLDIKPYIN